LESIFPRPTLSPPSVPQYFRIPVEYSKGGIIIRNERGESLGNNSFLCINWNGKPYVARLRSTKGVCVSKVMKVLELLYVTL